MKIILFQPQIPQNTGNIIRTCCVTGTGIILVPPLGFSISKRACKRAGLDYIDKVPIEIVENLEEFLEKSPHPFFFFSSKATKNYSDISYPHDSYLIFGSETSGLPPHFFEKWDSQFVRIPMKEGERCLNLSVSVGIGLYEALRGQNFTFLK